MKKKIVINIAMILAILILVFAQVILIFVVDLFGILTTMQFYIIYGMILFSYAILLMVCTVFSFGIKIQNNNIRFKKDIAKRNIFFIMGTEMFIIMMTFLNFAINYPEGSFPISLELTYLLYFSYIIIMISCFIVGIAAKIIRHIKNNSL